MAGLIEETPVTPNPFDQACRYLLRPFVGPLLSWLLRLAPGRLDFVEWLDTRGLPWPGQPDRTCDTVAHLRDTVAGGVSWAVPVEFQSDPDPAMFGRGMVYLGNLWLDYRPTDLRGDRFEVGMIVVNLRGRGRCSRRMRLSGTKLLTRLGVVECNLSGLSAARTLARIEAGKAPAALLPWIPLFQGGGEPGIIAEWVRVAEAQTDAELRRVMPLAQYFAEAAGCIEAWREALRGWDVIKSQVFEEWTALADGKARREERATISLRILRRIQADLPADLEQAIRRIDDLARLDAVVESALSNTSIDEFRRATGL
jgi:hypothetical protein